MAKVRQKGTTPELAVATILKRQGHYARTNVRSLPGSPDFASIGTMRAVFVHGCFWHRHAGCKASTQPKQNAAFWAEKFMSNIARDRRKARQLRELGYRVMTVWECQLKSPTKLARLEGRLDRFFSERG